MVSGVSPGPRIRSVARGASTVNRTMVSVSMMCSSFAFVLVLHTCTRKLHRMGGGWSLLGLAAWVDSHLVPAEFSDHRADALLVFSEVVECSPVVGFAYETGPSD